MDNNERTEQYKKVRQVLWRVLIVNVLITILKITLGMITGSLAVVADGFHSMVDSSSNLIGLAAVRLADRPADEQYPYGYQRFETLGALAIGGLLLVAAWEIVKSVIERVIEGAQPEINWVTFGLVALTFPINLGVVFLETTAGKKLKSEILLADASHTKTDLYVTLSVIGSLVGVWLGWSWLDLLVAVGVVALILRASIGILKTAAGSLADTAGVSPEAVEEIARGVPGVRYVHNVRSRGTPDAIFVDLHVKVDPAMSTSQAHALASEVERQVCANDPSVVDAIVHVEPALERSLNEWEEISVGLKQIAEGMSLGLHDLHVHVDQVGDYTIELDLEINRSVTLEEAHKLADEFEARAQNYWPDAKRVITHLEPAVGELLYPRDSEDEKLDGMIREYLLTVLGQDRNLTVTSTILEGHKRVFVELPMRGEIPLVESHNQVEEIKRALFVKFPEISRVVVHVEPMVLKNRRG